MNEKFNTQKMDDQNKIRVSRPPSPPRRVLTRRRMDIICAFKSQIRTSPLECQPGTPAWILKLKDFMNEEDVTVHDIGRWIGIGKNKWIISDNGGRDDPIVGRSGVHKQPQTYQSHAATDASSAQSVHGHPQNWQPQWEQFQQDPAGQQYMIIPANGLNWSQPQPPRSSEPQQSGSTGASGPESNPATINIPAPPSMNLNNTQGGSNSSDMASDISLAMAALSTLSQVCRSHIEFRSCLLKIESILNVIQRIQRTSVLALTHKDAFAADVVKRTIKSEKGENLETAGSSGTVATDFDAQGDDEDIDPLEVDLLDEEDE